MPDNFDFHVTDTECLIQTYGEFIHEDVYQDFKEKVEFQLEHGVIRFILNAEKMSSLNRDGFNILMELLTAARSSGGDLQVIHMEHVTTESDLKQNFNLYFLGETVR